MIIEIWPHGREKWPKRLAFGEGYLMFSHDGGSYCSSVSNHPSFIEWWVVDPSGSRMIRNAKEMIRVRTDAIRGNVKIQIRISKDGIAALNGVLSETGFFVFLIHEGARPILKIPSLQSQRFEKLNFIEFDALYEFREVK